MSKLVETEWMRRGMFRDAYEAEQAASAVAPSEPQANGARCALDAGSIPVPSAEDYAALSRRWHELYADLVERDQMLNATRQRLDALLVAANDFIANVVNHHVAGWGDCQVQFDASFNELRRQAEAANERQPESNSRDDQQGRSP